MRVVCIVLFILWRWYGNLFSGPGKVLVLVLVLNEKVLVLVLTKKYWSWSWSWSWQKSLIYITGYSSTESVMSTICLDVWLHGSKKRAEIPRYEVLRLGFDHTSTQMVTLRARLPRTVSICHRSCLFSFAHHIDGMTELRRMAAACCHNGIVQLLVRAKIIDHRVRFFLTDIVLVFVRSHCCKFYLYFVLLLCPAISSRSRFRNM